MRRYKSESVRPGNNSPTTRAVIMAAGGGSRWKDYMGIPKQLAPVNGEPILLRTIRLLKERGIADIWVTVRHKGQYGELGVNEYVPQDNVYGIDRIYSSRELAPAVWLYGDCYYTEQAMDTILKDTHDFWFFGRYGKSTTKSNMEIYAIKANDYIIEKAGELRELVRKKSIRQAIGQTLHRYIEGGRPQGGTIKIPNIKYVERKYFTEINDETEDFDTPQQYDRFVGNAIVKPPVQRPRRTRSAVRPPARSPVRRAQVGVSALGKFKDIHKGERCFVIGCGPSLHKTDLSLLKGQICIGVNRLIRSGLDIDCKYYAISDPLVWQDLTIAEIEKIKSQSTLLGRGRRAHIQLRGLPGMVREGQFERDITKGVHRGGTVVITSALPIAYYMGFSEVYLIGCDCDFTGGLHAYNVEPSGMEKAALRRRDPRNPLFTNDWGNVFKAYKVVKQVFEEDGRKIINCTVGGRLEVFPRMRLEDVV